MNVYEQGTKTVEATIEVRDGDLVFYIGRVFVVQTIKRNDGQPVPEGTDGTSVVLKMLPAHGEFFDAEHWPLIRSVVDEALKELDK